MGNIYDGPLLENPKFVRVKSLLLTGKVFEPAFVETAVTTSAGNKPPAGPRPSSPGQTWATSTAKRRRSRRKERPRAAP